MTHRDWLMVVEDATVECQGLFDYVPVGSGRVVITSTQHLDTAKVGNPLGIALVLPVLPLQTADSIEMWRRMNLFNKTPADNSSANDSGWSEDEWQTACVQTSGAVVYQKPDAKEKARVTRQRHMEMRRGLREHSELSTEGLKKFLEEELGNLPLSVKLIGHVIRANRLHVRDIISDFKRLRLAEVGLVCYTHNHFYPRTHIPINAAHVSIMLIHTHSFAH